MKSNMKKCLFLVCLCLVPFVVFSSSSFTSQNPIELPSGIFVTVVDVNGNPLDPRVSYRIISTGRGALGGDVYLGPTPNSSARCDNGVFRYNSDVGPTGTPVRFIGAPSHFRPAGIFENQDINMEFSVPTHVNLCRTYTIWKVGDYDVSLGARLLETGGTISQADSSWFKIVKAPVSGYNLFYCLGPFVCPSCPLHQCQAVGQVIQDGKRRLALVKDQPLSVNFRRNF